jgi:uncharacterized protein YdiU (UPF0061 family)
MSVAATEQRALRPLTAVEFETSFVSALPADPDPSNAVRQVRDAVYSFVTPTPVAQPRLLAWSEPLAEELGLERPRSEDDPTLLALAGNLVLPGMRPYAARYGGHQFGQWAGQLGDGRAITLAEMRDRRGTLQELQLKGAGRTPYSRFADGRAVLRSSLREFLCSEAMHHLGVPTTRALSLVATGEGVVRDMFYDGRPRTEPGAIVCRVALSFLRFGNLEIHAAQGERTTHLALLEYVLATHYPDIARGAATLEQRVGDLFAEVCRRTGVLISHWMRVGFVHGVMNTDNMSILGLTIDYGPYGWLEDYEPDWTPNTTDAEGRRYRFEAQPQIAQWNLARLAGALWELVPDRAPFEDGLRSYRQTFERQYRQTYAAKLGLERLRDAGDEALLGRMFEAMQASGVDFTIFFRSLAALPLAPDASDDALLATIAPASHTQPAFSAAAARGWIEWLRCYAARVRAEAVSAHARQERMNTVNPWIVPRNYLAQLAIDAAERGDLVPLERLHRALQAPYVERVADADLAARRPDWARHRPGCSMLSCSS